MMKKRFLGAIVLATLTMVAIVKVNISENAEHGLFLANVQALATPEGAGGECPNGGYWAKGARSESKETWYEKFDTKLNISLGLFERKGSAEAGISWQQVQTVAYNCDNRGTADCLVCNRYRL